MRDNLTIIGWDATVTSDRGIVFAALSRGRTGYGSGVRNVHLLGLTVRGSYAEARPLCPLALHHAEDVLVEKCRFIECQASRHSADLNGCRRITFQDCTFQGFHNDEGPAFVGAECIQVDYSYKGALSSDDLPGSFDGLMSTDITVDNCQFLPLTVGGRTYPCPNPIGSHGFREDSWMERIRFTNNLVVDPDEGIATDDGPNQSFQIGVIHLPGCRDVLIARNRFVQTTARMVRVLSFVSNDYVITQDSDPNLFPPQKAAITPAISARDIKIIDNTFEGFTDADAGTPAQQVIWLRGLPNGGEVRDVLIRDNTFRALAGTAGTGAPAIQAAHTLGLAIVGNRFNSTGRLVDLADTVQDAQISDNRANDVRHTVGGAALQVEASDYSVSGNRIRGRRPDAELGIALGSGTPGTVRSNSVTGFTTAVRAPDPLPDGVTITHNRTG